MQRDTELAIVIIAGAVCLVGGMVLGFMLGLDVGRHQATAPDHDLIVSCGDRCVANGGITYAGALDPQFDCRCENGATFTVDDLR